MTILDAFDTHDIGRGRGGTDSALASLTMPATIVGITSDIIFPPSEIRRWAALMPRARYYEIDSDMGHDGFLVEHDQLNKILTQNEQ